VIVVAQQQKRQKGPPHNLKRINKNGEGTSIDVRLMVFSDGGARGNPGPAAAAFLILSEEGRILKTHRRFIGLCTNNQAEYRALIAALESAAALNSEEVTCHLDSELVVKQLTGEYAVKNSELSLLWRKVRELRKHFKEVKFVNVPRTNSFIQRADELVNQTLDEQTRMK